MENRGREGDDILLLNGFTVNIPCVDPFLSQAPNNVVNVPRFPPQESPG